MRQIAFSLIVVAGFAAVPGAVADVQQPAHEIPEHGLGLLLETPDAPVGDIYSDRPVLT